MPREYRVGDELVAGFRLSGFLGRGGFGQVWRCQAPGGAELALKIIDLGRKEGLREYRALRLVKRIRHANLVPVVACWLRDDEGRLLEGLAESDYPTECFGNTLSVGQPAELIIAIAALGLCIGDVVFGALSQLMKSRRRAFWLAYLWIATVVTVIFLTSRTATSFFWLMFLGGVGAGYWAVFVTTAGETFGTNLRGTVATTAPSFVRGLVIPMTLCARALEPHLGPIGALAALGAVVLALAAWSVWSLPETFHRDMNFVEE